MAWPSDAARRRDDHHAETLRLRVVVSDDAEGWGEAFAAPSKTADLLPGMAQEVHRFLGLTLVGQPSTVASALLNLVTRCAG